VGTKQKCCSEDEQAQARAEMGYWKKHRSIDHVFASELAFSLIYNNVKADKQDQALATMGLTVLPDVMLLVQVDDYISKYSDIEITHEFYVKAGVRSCLQAAIVRSVYDGFAANLVGMDTLICFLCLPEEHDDTELYEFANDLRERVERETKIPVTICISDRCRKMSDYSKAYTKARDLLFGSFYLGKNAAVVSSKADYSEKHRGYLSQIMDYYPAICVALSNGDQERFGEIMQDVCRVLREQQVPPKQSKNNFAGLIHTMEVYAQNCGLTNKERVAPMTAKYAELVLRSGYLEDTVDHLTEYFAFLSQNLKQLPSRDRAQAFQEPIVEYVKNHFEEEITLNNLSEMTGYSTYYFTRMFKRYFGCTMTEYLTRFRIERSKKLLEEEDCSIGEVAARCGFDSANYFTSCFRSRIGLTPSQYRKDRKQ